MYVEDVRTTCVCVSARRLRCLAFQQPARHLKRRVFLSTVNSIIAGMVAVAGGAVAYNPWSAVVIGIIAAFSFLIWSKLLIRLQVDDPVETAAGRSKRDVARTLTFARSSHRWWLVGHLRRADLSTHGRTDHQWRIRGGYLPFDRLSHQCRRKLAGRTNVSIATVEGTNE